MSVKNFREGIRLVPVSADPTGPTEGQLQYSDGTARDEGVWVYSNGDWTEVGSSDILDVNCVQLINPTFDGDLTGWTFVTDVNNTSSGGTSLSTATIDSTNPIAGTGSASLNINPAFYQFNVGRIHTFETTITLASNLHKASEKIRVEFDIEATGTEPSGIFHTVTVELLENTSSTSLGSLTIFTSGDLGGPTTPIETDVVNRVIYEADRISSETIYILRVTIQEADNA